MQGALRTRAAVRTGVPRNARAIRDPVALNIRVRKQAGTGSTSALPDVVRVRFLRTLHARPSGRPVEPGVALAVRFCRRPARRLHIRSTKETVALIIRPAVVQVMMHRTRQTRVVGDRALVLSGQTKHALVRARLPDDRCKDYARKNLTYHARLQAVLYTQHQRIAFFIRYRFIENTLRKLQPEPRGAQARRARRAAGG